MGGMLRVWEAEAGVMNQVPNPGGGLKTDNGQALNWFQISGGPKPGDGDRASSVFVPAQARIVGPGSLEVRSDQVKAPQQVRFAWHPLSRHNLYNSEGLPAIPFHTDPADRK